MKTEFDITLKIHRYDPEANRAWIQQYHLKVGRILRFVDLFRKDFPRRENLTLLDIKEWRIAVLSSEVAIVTSSTRLSGRYKAGTDNLYDQNETLVFVKIDNAWKVVHDHVHIQLVEE